MLVVLPRRWTVREEERVAERRTMVRMIVVRAMGEEEEARVRMIERRWRPLPRARISARSRLRYQTDFSILRYNSRSQFNNSFRCVRTHTHAKLSSAAARARKLR